MSIDLFCGTIDAELLPWIEESSFFSCNTRVVCSWSFIGYLHLSTVTDSLTSKSIPIHQECTICSRKYISIFLIDNKIVHYLFPDNRPIWIFYIFFSDIFELISISIMESYFPFRYDMNRSRVLYWNSYICIKSCTWIEFWCTPKRIKKIYYLILKNRISKYHHEFFSFFIYLINDGS